MTVRVTDRPVLRFDDGGWLELIGNHAALDLVNTVFWRPEPTRTVDRIADGPALVRYAVFAGQLDPDPSTTRADQAAAEVRELREDVYAVVRSVLHGGPSAQAATAAERLKGRYAAAVARARLDHTAPLSWSVGRDAAADLPARFALEAVDLLRSLDPERLRECSDDSCGWVFLDQTRNRSRVWCSSGDCGNRARARRHYARRRAVGPD